jgi:SAM-dependent methyltransferase
MQYSKAFTDALQFMWGEGFLSPGGPDEVADMLKGDSVLGRRGGVDALLVSQHGAAEVIGVDVEEELVEASIALIATKGLSNSVKFLLVEPGPLPFQNNSFDLVFSKDAMVHILDKASLYKEVLRVLKPGGVFVAADWLWAERAESNSIVQAWISGGPLKFAYTTPIEATEALQQAGYSEVSVIDRSHRLRESNRKEAEILAGPALNDLVAIAGEEMAMQRINSTRGRQAALDSGNLIPSHLRGRKPA